MSSISKIIETDYETGRRRKRLSRFQNSVSKVLTWIAWLATGLLIAVWLRIFYLIWYGYGLRR